MFKFQKAGILLVVLFFFLFISPAEAQKLEKAYCMPSTAPLYTPPPVQFHNNRIVSITFKTTPEVIRQLLPKPLVQNPLNLMFAYVGRLNIEMSEGEVYSYLEAGIGVPSSFSGNMGNYAIYLYLDKTLPVVGGREIWGWPKKDAAIEFVEKDGKIRAKIERFGDPIITLNVSLLDKIDPIPVQPNFPWFNLKIIPSVERNAPPDVKQLTSTVNLDNVTKELYKCKCDLKFSSSPFDPLGSIEILEIVEVKFMVTDFVMDYGKILFNYLTGDEK